MKKRMLIIVSSCFLLLLLLCSCFYLWKIHHVPVNLELRSWFSVNLGCILILLWQTVILTVTIILAKKFISKQITFPFNIFYYFILALFCSSALLYLTWNFAKITITNDKDVLNKTGTLTVYHNNDPLKPDDYVYFLYEKEGILYRRYRRNMIDENDY